MKSGISDTIRKIIDDKGIKLTKVASATGIGYQRLNRIFNQKSELLASELIVLCAFLRIDPNVFIDAA